MNFADRDLKCSTCGLEFVFSAGEQEFFQYKRLMHEPMHCKRCAALRNADTRVRQMPLTHVTCAECGQGTTVPFKPRQNRPVLCRQCFDNQRKPIQTGTGLEPVHP
jgi:CxxC-x17-CxxC domain-containing protein